MSTISEREEIDSAYKWDLSSIFSSNAEWEDAYEGVSEQIEELRELEETLEDSANEQRGRVFPDGKTLLTVLEQRDAVMRRVGLVSSYARMRSHEDTRNQEYQAMSTRARSLASNASNAASFIQPAIQQLSDDELTWFIEETPGLGEYRHYLDDVFRLKEHTRSTEVEAVLSELGEVLGAPSEVYTMLLDADMSFGSVEDPDGEQVEVSQSNFTRLLKNPERSFRESVHETFYERLSENRNTIGAALKNSVKSHVKLSRIRGYDSALVASLDGSNIPRTVYETLIEAVEDNLDTLHRHVELKQANLGVDSLEMWDVYMPLTETESPTVPYDDAVEYVVSAVAPLGEDYQSQVREGLSSRWVDVYENRGKKSGAYSGGTYDTEPFILMNWQDDVSSLFTLAHELGHSMHSELASEHQPFVYGDYEIFVGEVASTVNETLLTHHLLDTIEDPVFRRHVLNEYLERFRATLFRQTMFADFELQIHTLDEEGEALTPDRLDSLYRELKERYYEPANIDSLIATEWMRIPHFYYNFYVYQYATGISAAVGIVNAILEEGESAASAYRDALKLGGSEYPLEILETAGVDMTTVDPVENAIDEYSAHLDEIAALMEAS